MTIDLANLGLWVYDETADRDRWRSERETHRMMRRRRDFELMLGPNPEEVTPEQRMRAWQLAESEPMPDRMTSDQMRECYGRARHL